MPCAPTTGTRKCGRSTTRFSRELTGWRFVRGLKRPPRSFARGPWTDRGTHGCAGLCIAVRESECHSAPVCKRRGALPFVCHCLGAACRNHPTLCFCHKLGILLWRHAAPKQWIVFVRRAEDIPGTRRNPMSELTNNGRSCVFGRVSRLRGVTRWQRGQTGVLPRQGIRSCRSGFPASTLKVVFCDSVRFVMYCPHWSYGRFHGGQTGCCSARPFSDSCTPVPCV